jgi:nucleolar protein TMA23
VRGEGIAGTLSSDDTPATSDSDAKSKRKRGGDTAAGAEPAGKSKKSKKDKKSKKASSSDTDVVAKKLAKLSVEEKKSYTERAEAKGQSLEEYVKRRIQKKEEQRAARYVFLGSSGKSDWGLLLTTLAQVMSSER